VRSPSGRAQRNDAFGDTAVMKVAARQRTSPWRTTGAAMQRDAHGHMLVELVITMALAGIVLAISVPNVVTMRDRYRVRAAAQDVLIALWAARNEAAMRGDYVAVVVDAPARRVRVVSGADTLLARDLGVRHGVQVSVTRDSITYAPTGLGYGAANTTIVVSRGRRADTITTSRLGRVR
jgi:Tfp pilus assembly protein FimT